MESGRPFPVFEEAWSISLLELLKLPALDDRIPDWKPFPQEHRECPFCGKHSAPLFLRPDNLPVSQCSQCRCFYVSVRMTDDALNAFYSRYWSDTRTRPLTDEMALYLTANAENRAKADHCLMKVGALSGRWKDRKVLDVGCGFGEKAIMMKSLGASVTGIDISAEAVVFMREKLDIPVYLSTVEALSGFENYFDVVTMFEFVEHPLDPQGALDAAFDTLKTGGLLAIVTPNGTEGERLMKEKDGWAGFRAEFEHLQYLHTDTISHIAGKVGFRIVHLEQFGYRFAVPDARNSDSPILNRLRRLIKDVPGVRRAVYTLRNFQIRRQAAKSPPREAGNYHLFTVLQKR